MKLGLSGLLTRSSIASPLTPLLLVAALGLGAIALLVLPREEEPQIRVPLVDIQVRANGLKAVDAVKLVTEPLAEIVKGIDGVEHTYSQTEDDRAVVTARFYVGTSQDDAILRVHEKIRANLSRIPIGIPEPLIVGRGINDVAIVVLSLSPKPEAAGYLDDNALFSIANELLAELVKVEDVGLAYIVGGRPNQIRIEPDPERLALYGVTLNQLVTKLSNANRSQVVGRVRGHDRSLEVTTGETLVDASDIGLLLITTADGRPVYVRDVASVVVGASPREHRAWNLTPGPGDQLHRLPLVSIALAKRSGSNAVRIADDILARLALVEGRVVPPDVDINITRNYGETASEKADELLFHLALATLSIVLLIAVSIGWREGLVVFVVVPTTILLTLVAAYLMGYTINRVSLFALIFSIGILVDDAIVVVENIHRHWRLDDGRSRTQAVIDAVAEVGNPTIMATLTVIAALMPMLFVSGLMGPYMSPIPANASAAMLFSFLVAVTVTPWLMVRLAARNHGARDRGSEGRQGWLARAYLAVARPLLTGRRRSMLFLLLVSVATVATLALFYTRAVTVKLLPFDNKSELQVVVDLPEGASLEQTERVLMALAERLRDLPELTSIQAYAGTAAPFNFNGLVRHYYLRNRPEQGDLQINLAPKDARRRASHDIALDVRRRITEVSVPDGTTVKVAEVPPGPPVIATLLAEIYGPDADARRATARRVRAVFESVPYIVDVDDSFGAPAERLRISVDQESLEFHGVEQQAVYDTIAALLGGVRIGYSHRGQGREPVEISVQLPKRDLYISERLLSTPVAGRSARVELGDVVRVLRERASYPLFRHNGRYVEMVMGELAGRFEAPIYGMLAVQDTLAEQEWGTAGPPAVRLHGQPADESGSTLLWDGEWEITYVTFRDMGAAFAVAILAIYVLVVGLFRSFRVPLVILVPVPLTIVGIVFGHWLFAAPFTATSMIGFIALAGIIVRNSILLVDFIRQRRDGSMTLRAVLLEAGAIRFRPIVLTALAAMIGAAFILADPIFQGLAISLLFGLASSTLLTVLVIPAIYVLLRDDGRGFGEPPALPEGESPQA
jgi:multidrug efflux pump subunit AcrB